MVKPDHIGITVHHDIGEITPRDNAVGDYDNVASPEGKY